MKRNPDIITTQPGLSLDQARDARARAWAFVFERWREKQEAARSGDPDDAERRSSEIGATRDHTR
jgi:hypothetical protein